MSRLSKHELGKIAVNEVEVRFFHVLIPQGRPPPKRNHILFATSGMMGNVVKNGGKQQIGEKSLILTRKRERQLGLEDAKSW